MPAILSFLFDVPDGFVDITNYMYRADEPPESLSVQCDPAEESDCNLRAPAEALARIQRRAEHISEGVVTCSKMVSVIIDGRAGQAMTMMAPNTPHSVVERLASVAAPQHLLTLFAYTHSLEDVRSNGQFEALLTSVRFDEAPRAPAHGHYRAHLVGLSFDVPLRLRPPTAMVFLSDDESIRLRISAQEKDADFSTVFVDESLGSTQITRIQIRPYRCGKVVGERCSTITLIHGRAASIHRAFISIEEHDARNALAIEFRGPALAEARIEHAFERLLASLRPIRI